MELLRESSVEPEVIEYLNTPPNAEQLRELLVMLGIPASELIRSNESDFQKFYSGKDLTEEECIAAMIRFPKLIQRPIVTNGTHAVIGRPAERI